MTAVTVSEILYLSEELDSGSLNVTVTNGTTLRVQFPEDISFEGARDLGNYDVSPAALESPVAEAGTPVSLVDAELEYSIRQSGSAAYVVDLANSLPPIFGTIPTLGSEGYTSNILEFQGTGTFGSGDVGDYIRISGGDNSGTYKIIGVYQPLDGIDLPGSPYTTRILLDQPLVLGDLANGYVQGRAEVITPGSGGGSPARLRLNHPNITPENALRSVLLVANNTTGVEVTESTFLFFPAYLTWVDHNTFEVDVPAFPINADDRVFIQARTYSGLDWFHISGVQAVTLKTRLSPGLKFEAGGGYRLTARNILTNNPRQAYAINVPFQVAPTEVVEKPRVGGASVDEHGMIRVRYDQPMRLSEGDILSPDDYEVTGPTTVALKRALAVSDREVALEAVGLDQGNYMVTVSTATPKDIAGNPLDPTYNTAIFYSGAQALTPRSIFTDKGPIAKPEESLQSGTGGTITGYTEVTLPGALLTGNEVGKRLRLSGGSTNAGDWFIASVLSTTKCVVRAAFTLPDADNHTWEVFDPRHGQIADDPADVTVRVNGGTVTPEAVIGLMGQIVLSSAPGPTDDVQVDYSWCCNPTVEVRRLNSREFRLNAYNRDIGYPNDQTQHKYRFNNVLVRPSDYTPDNPSAPLDQPLEREMHYRAYERAYTPVLNDPTLLLLNSPIHRIAYPPSQRSLAESFITYEGIGLPEANVTNPWERVGAGQATSASGVLTVQDDSTGVYPSGEGIFWVRTIDLTFDYVFAMSWRFSIDVVTTTEGVFTGIVAGFSDDQVATVVGFIDDGGTKKIGILKRGHTDDPSDVSSWIGGLDADSNPTDAPVEFDWSILHSYRIYQGLDRVIRVYVDGDLTPTLQVTRDDVPFLEELNAPFDELQGVFFGSVSRPAQSTSSWDFVRYLIQPGGPTQSHPSSFVSYEANLPPEQEARPWTPVGFHGTETIISTDFLLLDTWSASDVTDVGLVGGDYRGFVRFEPLLMASSEVVLDVNLQLQTHTHGPDANALMFAVDDGNRLMQVAFFPDFSTPKLSYGGRSFPEDFTPYTWSVMGSQPATMAGRALRISDASVTDGLVYYIEDANPGAPFTLPSSDDRIIAADIDYIVEFRCKVLSYTVDGSGFAGAFAQAFDGTRPVGAMLTETGGSKYVTLQADGVVVTSFVFDWGDSLPHTYRLSKNTTGDLVSLFVDGTFVGSAAYSSFPASVADPVGQLSFGSSTPASMGAESEVDWSYCNAFRIRDDQKRFVGLWKGHDADSLLGYHLPLKASGRDAQAIGNVLRDGNASFVADGVVAGDPLVVDVGDNRAVYEVAAVASPTELTITGTWPSAPALVAYRIVDETDWSTYHKYRLFRDSTGTVSILLDAIDTPIIQVGYNSLDLPTSGTGVVSTLADDLPAIAFGAFGPEDLSQSSWDYVRYGLTRSVTELRIVPHHEVLNQWNVMHSPERLFTQIPHTLTDFKSSSTGQPPKTEPDFLENAGLEAFTKVNEGTPIVPQTQAFETRAPFPVQEFVSGLNRPEDVLNSDGDFTTNNGALRFKLIVPDDVLYSCLDIIEQQDDGVTDVLTPFCDGCSPTITGIQYTNDVCLTYDGSILPENDTAAPTPWSLLSDTPGEVSTTAFAGILTYSTVGSATVYRNDTPLPDAPSLQTEAQFRIKLLQDATGGVDDTRVRFGISAPGMTLALAFVTVPTGERLVMLIDQNNGAVVGALPFDFDDGLYHDYRIVRDPSTDSVQVFIDS